MIVDDDADMVPLCRRLLELAERDELEMILVVAVGKSTGDEVPITGKLAMRVSDQQAQMLARVEHVAVNLVAEVFKAGEVERVKPARTERSN